MSIPYDIKVFEACQRLDSKIVTCSGIKSNDITDLITTDESGSEITLDKTALEAEIKKIEAELDALKYQYDRRVGTATTTGYGSFGEQLDKLYHDINAGKFGEDAKTGDWYVGISSVKTNFPKPS